MVAARSCLLGRETTCKQTFSTRCGISAGRAGGRRSLTPKSATKDAILQAVFYGSDGTRTRDLRRDRPLRGSRRLATMDAESLYSCGSSGFSRLDSAWLSQTDFRRLLPVCCPGWSGKRVRRASVRSRARHRTANVLRSGAPPCLRYGPPSAARRGRDQPSAEQGEPGDRGTGCGIAQEVVAGGNDDE
jgi:hypothetical protein